MYCAAAGRPHRPGLALTTRTAPGAIGPSWALAVGLGARGLPRGDFVGTRRRSKGGHGAGSAGQGQRGTRSARQGGYGTLAPLGKRWFMGPPPPLPQPPLAALAGARV